MSKARAQFIDPHEAGLRRHELANPVFAPEAVARADDTLRTMGESMQQWLGADVERLHEARLLAEQSGWAASALESLAAAAHDLKGMGATYGYPLASHLAASLCRLIETDAGKAAAREEPALVHAHVDAVRALLRDEIKTEEHPLGRAVLRELEVRVARLQVAPR